MEAVIARKLGMERCDEKLSLPRGDDRAVLQPRKHIYTAAHRFDEGARIKMAWNGRLFSGVTMAGTSSMASKLSTCRPKALRFTCISIRPVAAGRGQCFGHENHSRAGAP